MEDACPTCENSSSVDLSLAAFKVLAPLSVGELNGGKYPSVITSFVSSKDCLLLSSHLGIALSGTRPTLFSFPFFPFHSLVPEHASPALLSFSPRIRRQSKSSMLEIKCLTLTALVVTSQTSVVRLMTPSCSPRYQLCSSSFHCLCSLISRTLWSSRLALTCSRLLDSPYVGRVSQIQFAFYTFPR